MNPVFQDQRHNPPKQIGNCFSACLASIFEVPLITVPHFGSKIYEKFPNDPASARASLYWFRCVNAWLKEFGFYYTTIAIPNQENEISMTRGYHIIEGMSPRGFRHAVVGFSGIMAHDPHPEGTGLVKEEYHGTFTSLDPSKQLYLNTVKKR